MIVVIHFRVFRDRGCALHDSYGLIVISVASIELGNFLKAV